MQKESAARSLRNAKSLIKHKAYVRTAMQDMDYITVLAKSLPLKTTPTLDV
jgi:hypothetical protein